MVRALFLVEEDHAARQAVLRLCTHRWFDSFILAVILGNACMMAMEDPTQPDLVDPTREMLELACNVVFTVELLSKVFAYGFVIGEGTYLRSGWNILVRPIAPHTSRQLRVRWCAASRGLTGLFICAMGAGLRDRCIGVATLCHQ